MATNRFKQFTVISFFVVSLILFTSIVSASCDPSYTCSNGNPGNFIVRWDPSPSSCCAGETFTEIGYNCEDEACASRTAICTGGSGACTCNPNYACSNGNPGNFISMWNPGTGSCCDSPTFTQSGVNCEGEICQTRTIDCNSGSNPYNFIVRWDPPTTSCCQGETFTEKGYNCGGHIIDTRTADCTGSCAPPCSSTCGDGAIECSEQCDDGNTNSGDGCSSQCITEGCYTNDILHGLRKALYAYYVDPSESGFTSNELKALLSFYVSIGSSQITIDCTPQSDNIDRANTLPDNIPSCSDGTKYGKCSSTKPMYCYAGRLVPRCRHCGCPGEEECDEDYVYTEKGNKGRWGKCNSDDDDDAGCSVDSDCGTSGYVGNYYCQNEDVYRNYNRFTCVNPGNGGSSCINQTTAMLIDDCQAGEECAEGQSECQAIISDDPPTVSISIAPTTVTAGEFFNVTVTGTDDTGLNMIWWWGTDTPDTELNKAHTFGCNGATTCSNTWLVSTDAVGTLTLGANSRDITYADLLACSKGLPSCTCTEEDLSQCPGYGEPHQASEGDGIAYATVTVINIPATCTDSDNGENMDVYGSVSGNLDGSAYTYNDYCIDDGSVMEYYCVGDTSNSQVKQCGNDGFIGARYCTGDDIYQDFRDYSCSSGKCTFDETPTLIESCEFGCSGGECKINYLTVRRFIVSYSDLEAQNCGAGLISQEHYACRAKRWCTSQGFESGFESEWGFVNQQGEVHCFSGNDVNKFVIPYSYLEAQGCGAGPTSPEHYACRTKRWCVSQGYEAGYQSEWDYNTQTGEVSCFTGDGIDIYLVSNNDLEAQGCGAGYTSPEHLACRAKRWCVSRGYDTGFQSEWGADYGGVVYCIRSLN